MPKTFLTEVARPNATAALADPDDMRAIVNAILTLDSLVGMIHAHGKAAHPLHLTGEEWNLIIEALRRTAKPYADRKPSKRSESGGGDAS